MAELTSCSNPLCQIIKTGKCVEGFEALDECPHYGESADEESVGIKSPAPDESRTKIQPPISENDEDGSQEVKLSPGNALTVDEATTILRSSGARVVAIIGPIEAGKTTLISAIYDLFGRGPFAGLSFAGSETLAAFERLRHRSLAISRRTTPTTERTSRSPRLGFLHLAVAPDGDSDPTHLLFSDRSGEDYEAAADNVKICSELTEVSRADVVMVLLDGEKLAQASQRHTVFGFMRMIVEALVDAGVVGRNHRLAIVLTKFDLVAGSQEEEVILKSFEDAEKWINEQLGESLGEVRRLVTAARPTGSGTTPGLGLDEVLEFCTQVPIVTPFEAPSKHLVATRAYHRLTGATDP